MRKVFKTKAQKQALKKTFYWLPRVLAILTILFFTLFSLDVFAEHASFLDIVMGLLMHNIPTIILVAALVVAWKHEIIGGWAFILLGIISTLFFRTALFLPPLALIGGLFLFYEYKIQKIRITKGF